MALKSDAPAASSRFIITAQRLSEAAPKPLEKIVISRKRLECATVDRLDMTTSNVSKIARQTLISRCLTVVFWTVAAAYLGSSLRSSSIIGIDMMLYPEST